MGYKSNFTKSKSSQAQDKAQESQKPEKLSGPEPLRRKDPRPETRFNTSETLESEASETHLSKTFESEALASEALEFMD